MRLSIVLLLATGCATMDTRSRACRSVAAFPLACSAEQMKAEIYSPSAGTIYRFSSPSSVCVAKCEDKAMLCSERKGIWGCHPTVLSVEGL